MMTEEQLQEIEKAYIVLREDNPERVIIMRMISEIRSLQEELDQFQCGDLISRKEARLWRDNQKIQAIKELRRRTGLGLKEAKDLFESRLGMS